MIVRIMSAQRVAFRRSFTRVGVAGSLKINDKGSGRGSPKAGVNLIHAD